ncbi:hypothetical protein A5686_23690 [Mycobacterium sp. E2479]|nr:hypothetical protein A5686_23690 [Mycobacterium sp. E2479]
MTGYTNEVLDAIRADGRLELGAVFTRCYDAPYPYYPIPQIHEVCAELGIPCHTNLRVTSGTGLEMVRGYDPEMILMTGFDQILAEPLLDLPRLGVVNMHPSLLPRFRGPDPIQAALLGEAIETGVTYHYAVPEVDAGNILIQRTYPIRRDETNASLRLGLARLAASCLPQLIDLFECGVRPVGMRQEVRPTPRTQRIVKPVSLDQSLGLHELHKIVRAVVPYPGATVRVGGVDRIVNSSTLIERTSVAGTDNASTDGDGRITWERDGARLVLTLDQPGK